MGSPALHLSPIRIERDSPHRLEYRQGDSVVVPVRTRSHAIVMADPTYGIKLTFYMNPHTSRVMKKSALVMVLSLLATPAMADPWYGRELGSDSQEAKISCRSWPMGWGTFRASEISLAEGIPSVNYVFLVAMLGSALTFVFAKTISNATAAPAAAAKFVFTATTAILN